MGGRIVASIQVVLETESGEQCDLVTEPRKMLINLLPGARDESFPLLRYVDPYGLTIFNRLQMDSFLPEWARLYDRTKTVEEREHLKRIESLARRCRDEVHLYLKFVGD
jgi:hypothetical protein